MRTQTSKFSVLLLPALLVATATAGCNSQDIPPAHRGQMFDMSGALALWIGGDGLTGPVLNSGTYYTGFYDKILMVDCSTVTQKETLPSQTKDNVQCPLDVYIRYSANCATDEAVVNDLKSLKPDANGVIESSVFYNTYIRPALGEAVRSVVAPYNANDLNNAREKVLGDIRIAFLKQVEAIKPPVVIIDTVVLSNLELPADMRQANVDRAVQSVLRDKAEASTLRIEAESLMQDKQKELSRKEGESEAARITAISAALRDNPSYLQYMMIQAMPTIYKDAGVHGNMVLTAPNPTALFMPRAMPAAPVETGGK